MLLIDNATQAELLSEAQSAELLEQALSALDAPSRARAANGELRAQDPSASAVYRFSSQTGWADGLFVQRLSTEPEPPGTEGPGHRGRGLLLVFRAEDGMPLAMLHDGHVLRLSAAGGAALANRQPAQRGAPAPGPLSNADGTDGLALAILAAAIYRRAVAAGRGMHLPAGWFEQGQPGAEEEAARRARVAFPDAGSRSAELAKRAQAVLPGGNSRSTIDLRPYSIYITRGEGSRVFDVDGNAYVDFNNNYTSLIRGHADPAVTDAVAAQLPLGTAFAFATEQELVHAEGLCARVPGFDKVRFMNSGSEAVMNALKAARAFTGRAKIAKCEGAYHGSYDYAEVSLSAGPEHWDRNAPASVPYARGTPQGVLDDVVVIPYHDTLAARELLRAHADTLAAVLFDPVASRVGMLPPSPDYLAMLVEFCEMSGALLVFDEVIAFRLGVEGAQGVYGVRPDLTALGKIIGGGFPVGAVAGSEQVMAVFEAGGGLPHGGTFNGNPVTMVAGHATMEAMDAAAFAALNDMGEYARSQFREAFERARIDAQVTGQSSLLRLHLTGRQLRDYRSVYPTPEETSRMAALHRHLLNAGHAISSYGMVCLSTRNTTGEVDALVRDVVDGLQRTAASPTR